VLGGLSAAGAPAYAARRPSVRAEAAPAPGSRAPYVLLLAFLLLVYANVPLLVPSLAKAAPAQTLAIGALVLLFVDRAVGRRPVRLSWPESHLLIAFVGVALLSSFSALWASWALDTTLLLAKCVAVYLLIVNTVAGWQRLRTTYVVIAIGALFPALGALHHYRIGLYAVEGRIGWLGIFENPNDLAFALVVATPIAAALAITSRGWRRLLFTAMLPVYALAVFLTYSRGGLLGFAAVVGLCVLRWGSPWARISGLLLFASLLVFVVPRFWQRDAGLGNLDHDHSLHQRLGTVKAGLAMVADRPLLGVGPGCSVIGWPIYAPRELQHESWLQTHNTIILALCETGILGAAAFLGAVAAGLGKARRMARAARRAGHRERHRLSSALEISLWGFLVCGLAGGYMTSWFPYIVLGLVSAAAAIPRAPAPAAAPAAWPEVYRECVESPAS
jgi:O-antigen ligase